MSTRRGKHGMKHRKELMSQDVRRTKFGGIPTWRVRAHHWERACHYSRLIREATARGDKKAQLKHAKSHDVHMKCVQLMNDLQELFTCTAEDDVRHFYQDGE